MPHSASLFTDISTLSTAAALAAVAATQDRILKTNGLKYSVYDLPKGNIKATSSSWTYPINLTYSKGLYRFQAGLDWRSATSYDKYAQLILNVDGVAVSQIVHNAFQQQIWNLADTGLLPFSNTLRLDWISYLTSDATAEAQLWLSIRLECWYWPQIGY